MPVRVYRDGGIVIEVGGRRILADPISLPREKPDVIFVSHAHSDHYRLKPLRVMNKVPKLMSKATKELIDPRNRIDNVVFVDAGSSIEVAGLQLSTYNAGHVIGSLQLVVKAEEQVVYTGDFNIEQRIVLRPAPILRADVLIIDATYGHPRYAFPPRSKLYKQILKLVKEALEKNRGLLFAARSLGTGQELTALLSLVARLVPLVERRIGTNNKLYEKYGEQLGNYVVHPSMPPYDSIAIIPLSERCNSAIPCTGWATGKGVPLSSHADFDDLVRYALESQAQRIYAFSAHAKSFAELLTREAGIEVVPVDR